MELNPIWIADASFFLNSALLGAVCGFMFRSLQRKLGGVVGAIVTGVGLAGIILMTGSARGVVHDALVAQAATEQVESVSQMPMERPPPSTFFSTDALNNHPF